MCLRTGTLRTLQMGRKLQGPVQPLIPGKSQIPAWSSACMSVEKKAAFLHVEPVFCSDSSDQVNLFPNGFPTIILINSWDPRE